MIFLCWVGIVTALISLAVAGWRGDFVLGLLAAAVGCYCWMLLGEVMLDGEDE